MEMFSSKKPLSSYVVEFLLLFLAVTLGFFAENYRESLVDRKTEKMYLESLVGDLAQDTLKINFSISSKETKEKHFDTLYTILHKTPKPWPTRKLYYLSRLLSIREPFYGTDGTIHQLENSGGFKLIRNHELIDKISNYSGEKEKIYQIQVSRDLTNIQYKQAVGKVFVAKELAFLFDPVKFHGKPYFMGEPTWDPPLIGNDENLNEFFYWASTDIFIEKNSKALLYKLKTRAKNLIADLEKELENFD